MSETPPDSGGAEQDSPHMDDESRRHAVVLEPYHEWRFEVGFDAKLVFRIVEGTAELFGTELARGREYEFSGQNAAVFTYHGCKLEWEGKCSEYSAANPTMARYSGLHFALENLRRKTHEEDVPPPCVLLIGPRSSGKSTLAKILVSYATKMGRYPVLVNLDPTAPVFGPPGSLVAVPISHILDIEAGFGQPPINGPAATHHKQPLVYNFGWQRSSSAPEFYGMLVSQLASGLKERMAADQHVKESGVIIDTPNNLADVDDENSMAILKKVVDEFGVTAVFVIGKERLSSKLKMILPTAQVLNIPQCGGVTEESESFERQAQRRAISQYFFGSPSRALSPYTVTVPMRDVKVYRPLEQDDNLNADSQYLTPIPPSAVLQNRLLAVVNADLDDSIAEVAKAETLGYLNVVEADETKSILKILLPVPGRVPRRPLIMGSYQYHE